jgi:hypothetical protein
VFYCSGLGWFSHFCVELIFDDSYVKWLFLSLFCIRVDCYMYISFVPLCIFLCLVFVIMRRGTSLRSEWLFVFKNICFLCPGCEVVLLQQSFRRIIKRSEEFFLLGYNVVYSVESQPTFRRSMLPPSSEWKNKPRKKPT